MPAERVRPPGPGARRRCRTPDPTGSRRRRVAARTPSRCRWRPGGVAHRRPEAEGEAHHQLRPPRHPLGQRIEAHQHQRAHPQGPAQPRQLQQHQQPEPPAVPQATPAACRIRSAPEASGRPAVRATLPVQVAVPHVIDHAAGAAHHHAADGEQQHQPGRAPRRGAPDSSRLHNPGRNSSHAPIGRSSRSSSAYGRQARPAAAPPSRPSRYRCELRAMPRHLARQGRRSTSGTRRHALDWP